MVILALCRQLQLELQETRLDPEALRVAVADTDKLAAELTLWSVLLLEDGQCRASVLCWAAATALGIEARRARRFLVSTGSR